MTSLYTVGIGWLFVTQKGDLVLHAAARHGQLEALKFFTVHGQTLNVQNQVSSSLRLHRELLQLPLHASVNTAFCSHL